MDKIAVGLLADFLEWLATPRFIETDWDADVRVVAAREFLDVRDQYARTPERVELLTDFFCWMDEGDRIDRLAPYNPYGENLQFTYTGYGNARACAEDMARLYREEVEGRGAPA